MKISFSGLFKARDKPQNAVSSAPTFYFGSSGSGKSVTAQSAVQLTTVYACVRVIAETIASLPFNVYEQTDSGSIKAKDHPLQRLLHDEPNPEMTSFVWRETMLTHLLLYGNSYCQIIRTGRSQIDSLYPLLPDHMEVDRDSKGNLTAEAKNDLQKVLYQAIFKGGSQQLEEMFNKLPSKAQRAILATAFRDMDSPFAGKMLPEIQASIAAFNQLMSDTTFATANFFKSGAINVKVGVLAAIGSFAGSALGAHIVLLLSDEMLRTMMFIILPVAAVIILWQRNLPDENRDDGTLDLKKILLALAIGLGIGLYDGIMGPGTGTFAIIAFTTLMGFDLRTANGNGKVLNLASNYASLFTYLMNGLVVFHIGIPCAISNILGNLLGSHFALKKGARFIRPMMLVVLVLLLGKIVSDAVL